MIREELSRLPLRATREELVPVMDGSDEERLDRFCARFGSPLEHLWSIRDQPTVRMVDPVTDAEMRARFDESEQLLELVESWHGSGGDARRLPAELDRGLADRSTRLDLERLTVMIRRRNDRRRH